MTNLRLSHSTMAVRDIDVMLAFYCEVLGFHVTDRGTVNETMEMAFISQDPAEHHQIVMVQEADAGSPGFMLADHLAFRTGSLDDLRAIGAALDAAEVEMVLPISHGNAWSLYFTDPEGNGIECFVDSPFHVAQPFGGALDLSATDVQIAEATRAEIEALPDFSSMSEWRAAFEARLVADAD